MQHATQEQVIIIQEWQLEALVDEYIQKTGNKTPTIGAVFEKLNLQYSSLRPNQTDQLYPPAEIQLEMGVQYYRCTFNSDSINNSVKNPIKAKNDFSMKLNRLGIGSHSAPPTHNLYLSDDQWGNLSRYYYRTELISGDKNVLNCCGISYKSFTCMDQVREMQYGSRFICFNNADEKTQAIQKIHKINEKMSSIQSQSMMSDNDTDDDDSLVQNQIQTFIEKQQYTHDELTQYVNQLRAIVSKYNQYVQTNIPSFGYFRDKLKDTNCDLKILGEIAEASQIGYEKDVNECPDFARVNQIILLFNNNHIRGIENNGQGFPIDRPRNKDENSIIYKQRVKKNIFIPTILITAILGLNFIGLGSCEYFSNKPFKSSNWRSTLLLMIIGIFFAIGTLCSIYAFYRCRESIADKALEYATDYINKNCFDDANIKDDLNSFNSDDDDSLIMDKVLQKLGDIQQVDKNEILHHLKTSLVSKRNQVSSM